MGRHRRSKSIARACELAPRRMMVAMDSLQLHKGGRRHRFAGFRLEGPGSRVMVLYSACGVRVPPASTNEKTKKQIRVATITCPREGCAEAPMPSDYSEEHFRHFKGRRCAVYPLHGHHVGDDTVLQWDTPERRAHSARLRGAGALLQYGQDNGPQSGGPTTSPNRRGTSR